MKKEKQSRLIGDVKIKKTVTKKKAKERGVRLKKEAVDFLHNGLEAFLEGILIEVEKNAKLAGRKTINLDDVKMALHRRAYGRALDEKATELITEQEVLDELRGL